MNKEVKDRIKYLRENMLIHCYLYYVKDITLIDDHTWQARAEELRALQEKYGVTIDYEDTQFKDWDASTGYHLKYNNHIMHIAERLLVNAGRAFNN